MRWQADICQLGMDQRKVNVLAREYCDKIKRKLKPVILSHEMLPGLLEVRAGGRSPLTGQYTSIPSCNIHHALP